MKLLAIGNSFAINSLTYLSPIFENAGVPLTVGKVSIGGCPLDLHWYNAENDIARYGDDYEGPYTMRQMLESEQWDVVTMQQVSHLSWRIGSFYPYFENLAEYVKKYAPQARFAVQQTWAYRTDNERLIEHFRISQRQMHMLLSENYREMADKLHAPVMPVGEAFAIMQELTNDPVGSLTRNNDLPSHANALGQFIGGLTWDSVLTGGDVDDITFVPEQVDPTYVPIAKQAIKAAIARWSK